MIGIENYPVETGEFKDNDLVCYCFGYTRKDIEKDYLDNGRSVIFEKIAFGKRPFGPHLSTGAFIDIRDVHGILE